MIASALSPEVESMKTRLKHIWMAGDYDRFSRYMESGAREFYERLEIIPGCRLLDVGCGSGQLALMAAKDGLEVTGVDIASNSVERARERAAEESLRVRFEEADAEALPFEDASFDVVASLIGAIFAPRPDRVAQELLRVCKSGGTIAMANWTPQGFIGQMFKTVSTFIAPSGMLRRSYGATKPLSVKGSAGDCRSSIWPGATIRSVIPFLLRRWWSSSVSTTDQSIGRSLR